MSLPSVAFQCPSEKIRLPSRSHIVWPPASAPTSFSSKKLSTSFSFFHLQPLCLPLLPSQLLRDWGLPQRGQAGSHPPLFFFALSCRIFIPQPGIKPAPPAVGAWNPNLDSQGSTTHTTPTPTFFSPGFFCFVLFFNPDPSCISLSLFFLGSQWLSFLYIVSIVYIYVDPNLPIHPIPNFPPWYPYICLTPS